MSVTPATLKKGLNLEGFQQFLSSTLLPMMNALVDCQYPTFTQASTKENIQSGENHATIFGKISKFLADLDTNKADKTEVESALEQFADVETSPAGSAHSVGDYILYNKNLYRVTRAIQQGMTLTVGTNIVKTTVGAEIRELTRYHIGLNTETNRLSLYTDGE